MKKISVLILLMGMCLITLLTSCETFKFETDPEKLMRPPTLSEDQAEIYHVLADTIGENFTLKYPRSGPFRSAVVLVNLDDDAEDEALVFYDTKTRGEFVRIKVLDKINGHWQSMYDAVGASDSVEVDRVYIERLEPGQTHIVVGYTLWGARSNALRIYQYENGSLLEVAPEIAYYDMAVLDRHGNGVKDLVYVADVLGQREAEVKLAYFDRSGELVISEGRYLHEIESTSNAIKLYATSVGDGNCYIYVDELIGSEKIATDLFKIVEDRVEFVDMSGGQEYDIMNWRDTARREEWVTSDFDFSNDYEIPLVPRTEIFDIKLDSFGVSPIEQVVWGSVDETGFFIKYRGLYNDSGQYFFVMPKEWEKQIIAEAASEGNEMILRLAADGYGEARFISILAYPRDHRINERIPAEYEKIDESNTTLYYARILYEEGEGVPVPPLQIPSMSDLENWLVPIN